MAEPVTMKCKFYNSGYCKFSRTQQGCKQNHPKETCQQLNCKNKSCPLRHPKKCRYKEKCMYQTRCSYSHKQTPDTREEISNDIEDIKVLKAEIANLKNENNKKINILVKVHLKEMNDLREDMDKYKAYASNLIKEKDVELSNSLIVNIGLEQEIKTLKYDLRLCCVIGLKGPHQGHNHLVQS